MIRLEQISKRFSEAVPPALDHISVEILPGRITGLAGPDGAGKTTLLRILAGLLEPTEGKVSLFGFDATSDTGKIKPILGYMPQKFGLYEDLTVIENLKLFAEIRGLPKSEQSGKIGQLLDFTLLDRFTNRLVRRLSGGMKQKLGLACTLITAPKLLFLDEPSVGVDPVSRRELWKMIRTQMRDETVVVWSTSYLDETELCDDVLLLNEGKQLFFGPPSEMTKPLNGRVFFVYGLQKPERREYLAESLKDESVRDGQIQGDAVRLTFSLERSEEMIKSNNLSFRSRPIIPAQPTFEDGFIDRLGGILQRESPLAARFHTVPKTDKPIVIADRLTKRFGTFTAADQISFTISQGEILGLLGPNGAGKSTTFKMLCGLLRPTQGTSFISGWNLQKSSSRARSRIGYMAQKFSLYSDLTVNQNLNFYGGIYGLHGRKLRESVDRILDLFDLVPFASAASGTLPLGYKQRLSLGAALIHEPDVLFLDEPTSGVDPLTRREFWGHINTLASKGVTVLITTHFMDEAEYCDRIILISGGQKAAEGTPDQLKNAARSDSNRTPTLEDAFIYFTETEKR